MSELSIIQLDPAKAYQLPYAPAVDVPAGSEYVFLSGATGIPLYHAHPHIAEECVLPDDIAEQTRRVMANVMGVLESLGLGWGNVIHTYEFVTDLRDADEIHAAMGGFLGDETWTPAATLIGVNSLSAPGARLELDVIAVRPPASPTEADGTAPVSLPALGGVSPAVSVRTSENLLWMSGATAIPLYHHHPHIEAECVVPDDAREQTRRILATFDEVLAFCGVGWGDVVKMTQFATDFRDKAAIDETVEAHLGGLPVRPPVMAVDIAGLSGPGARLEIEVIARRPSDGGATPAPAVITQVHTEPERKALLPYAPAITVSGGSLHFLSEVGPLPLGEVAPLPDDIVAQTRMLMDNLEARLEQLGLRWTNVVKTLMFVTDIRESDAIGAELGARYGSDWTPASTLLQVDALEARGARVQLDVIAAG